MGQECPRPGIGVFQRMLCSLVASQANGGNWPSATPEPRRPRNEGQFNGDATMQPGSSVSVIRGAGSMDGSTGRKTVSVMPRFQVKLATLSASRQKVNVNAPSLASNENWSTGLSWTGGPAANWTLSWPPSWANF